DKFQPRDRKLARQLFDIQEGQVALGCIMTNQPRKDWGVLLGAVAEIRRDRPTMKLRVLCRTDDLFLHWNIPALIDDYGLTDGTVEVALGQLPDEELSWWYSACDLTVLPSLGEGFGYPIVESLACGVPCVHVNYGGGAELVKRFDSSY